MVRIVALTLAVQPLSAIASSSPGRSAMSAEHSSLVQTRRGNDSIPDLGMPQSFSEEQLMMLDYEAAAPVSDGWYPAVEPTVGNLTNIEWLHMPKTGTSFIATLVTYTCGQEKMIDLDVDPKVSPRCAACYDFALQERYPWPDYEHCQAGVMSSHFQTQHRPVSELIASSTNVVTMFRKPNQRVISAFHNDMHANGFGEHANAAAKLVCKGSVGCFARLEGIAGCATRMLTGGTCAEDPAQRVGEFDGAKSLVPAATQTLQKLAFVGLTEEWDESVCLFHVMFGGRPYAKEFKNMHPGNVEAKQGYPESDLDGWVDEADEELYMHATHRFEKLKNEHCTGSKSCCHALFGTEEPEAENDLSCSRKNLQCDDHEDIACGNCAAQRMGFLGENHPEMACVNAQCHVKQGDHPRMDFFRVNYFDQNAGWTTPLR